MKTGKNSIMTADQQTNATNLLTAFAEILGNNVEIANVPNQVLSMLNGKSLDIVITFAPKNQGSITETYTLRFVYQQPVSLMLNSLAEDTSLSESEDVVTPPGTESLPVEEAQSTEEI